MILEIVTIGAIANVTGAVFLARNFIITKARAVELSVSRVSSEIPEENLTLPAVKDRLNQRRDAIIGLPLNIAGTILLVIGSIV